MKSVLLFLMLNTIYISAQVRLPYQWEDSLCKSGKKYIKPERVTIPFPAQPVTDEYKLQELHRAIPDTLHDETDEKWWFYNYYFEADIADYDPVGDSVFYHREDKLTCKLKDTYFFDINGDGLMDFIHYPKYYMALMRNDFDFYELFLQTEKGYQWITFSGFITDIKFNTDGTLDKMTTYQGACWDDNQCTFFYYQFNKKSNQLILVKTEQLFTCQLIKN